MEKRAAGKQHTQRVVEWHTGHALPPKRPHGDDPLWTIDAEDGCRVAWL